LTVLKARALRRGKKAVRNGHVESVGVNMAPQDGRPTVLVAEDVALVRLNLVQQLEDGGFRVIEARDAESALASLEAGDPIQIVLTDLNMPGAMDGRGLLRWGSTLRVSF